MSYIPQLDSLISVDNSTTAPLGASGNFTGVAEDVSDFATITITIATDVTGSFTLQQSSDGVNWDVSRTAAITPPSREYIVPVVAQYARILYDNDATPQSYLRLQTRYHKEQSSMDRIALDGELLDDSLANTTRSVLAGKNESGRYNNVKVTEGSINVNITDPTSPFGEVTVVEPNPVVQIDFIYNINNATTTTALTGTGTAVQANSLLELNTSAAINSSANVESKRYIKYRQGQGGLARFTSIFTDGVVGSRQLAGLGDDQTGLYFGYNGTDFGIARFDAGVEHWVNRDDWNIDKLDGTSSEDNPSGMLLNTGFGNVFEIAFQWLGFGAITFSIESDATGDFIPVHRIKYANQNLTPSVPNPSFPLNFLVENTTNTTDIAMKVGSASGFIQGPKALLGPTFATNAAAVGVTAVTNILTIRNKSTFQGITNRVPVIMDLVSTAVDGTKPALLTIIKNGILTGPVWTDINTNDSVVEFDSTATITGGESIAYVSLAKIDSNNFVLKDFDIELFPGETISILITPTSGTTDVLVSAIWTEDN